MIYINDLLQSECIGCYTKLNAPACKEVPYEGEQRPLCIACMLKYENLKPEEVEGAIKAQDTP